MLESGILYVSPRLNEGQPRRVEIQRCKKFLTYRPPPRSERYGIARCWQQWITEGRVHRRGGSGRPRNTNDREDRAIRRVATSAPTTSLASIQRHLPPSRHPVPSRETVRRRLTEVGLRPTSAKTLTDPIIGSVDWILPTSGNLECDRLETCHLQ
ncbi:hypothetical protein TNCV_4749251 [Trichonephila clavipes]|nr:hypothetical protein TNCV_4749251 [Trichonephila clavipes]